METILETSKIETKKIAKIELHGDELEDIEIYAIVSLEIPVEGRNVVVKKKTLNRSIYPIRKDVWTDNFEEREEGMLKEANDIAEELKMYEVILRKLREKGYKIVFDTDC